MYIVLILIVFINDNFLNNIFYSNNIEDKTVRTLYRLEHKFNFDRA